MFNRLMNWLVPKLEAYLLRKGRFLHITGTDAPDDVYLVRYFLLRTKLLSIYIHRFLRSDRDDHHDHPFDFLSYIVQGRYTESLLTGGSRGQAEGSPYNGIWHPEFTLGVREQGTFGFRRAEAIHMVLLDKEYKLADYYKAPLTVIFRGPERRRWGFWKWYPIKNGIFWVFWKEYLGIKGDEVRE